MVDMSIKKRKYKRLFSTNKTLRYVIMKAVKEFVDPYIDQLLEDDPKIEKITLTLSYDLKVEK